MLVSEMAIHQHTVVEGLRWVYLRCKVTYADSLQQIILLQRTDYSIFITDYHNRGLWSLMALSSIRSPLRDNAW